MIIEHKTLDLYGKMVFEKAIINPPFRKPNPMPDEACFLYILKGKCNYIAETDQVMVSEKEAVLLKCGSFLAKMFESNDNNIYEAVAVHFYPEVLNKIYDKELPSLLKKNIPLTGDYSMVKWKTDELLQKYFDSILFYFSNPELVNEELISLKIKELFLLLENTQSAPLVRTILSNLFSHKTYSFKEVIESHVFSDLSLEDIAQIVNMSLSSFKREFKRIYNDSPARYIKNRKLKKAAELLLKSDLPISEIAYQCGFNELPTFSTAFKDQFKVPPSVYRASGQKV